VMLLNDV
jgi:fumarylacetoacetate (FAA) hydrolase